MNIDRGVVDRGYRPGHSCSLEALAVANGILVSPASQHPLVERMRLRLSSEGTNGTGFARIQKRLRCMDHDGSRLLSLQAFKTALQSKNHGPLLSSI